MINLLHFQFLPHVPTVTAVAVLSSVAAILILSRVGSELFENTVGTVCGWFETKTPDAPTAKPSSVTTSYIFGQRAVYVGRNYPAKTHESFTDTEFYKWYLTQKLAGTDCRMPPDGWFCPLGSTHTGPCPARLVPRAFRARQKFERERLTCGCNGCQSYRRRFAETHRLSDRPTTMPAVLGAPYDFSSPAYQAFIGAPPSVNATIAAPNFVPEPDYKTCPCAACRDFRNRVFKTDPGALGAPHDEFAARAWQVEQRAAIKREQVLDEARLYLHNQKHCKHPKGFQYLGRCPVCFMAGDDLR